MSSLELPRPGSLALNPERPEPSEHWLDQAVTPARGLVKRLRHGRVATLRRVAELVAEAGREVATYSEDRLAFTAADLRVRLRAEGMKRALVVQAFALVRELADRRLGLRHHDVQVMGGWAMLHGLVAEMETGEGKTLTATLPAGVAALSGLHVHVISVNDYLVARDAEWMRPVYEGLGLSVGTVVEQMSPEERRGAYRCDVTYVSNKHVAFDYLRDRLVLKGRSGRLRPHVDRLGRRESVRDRLLLRGLVFGIVDEADSVLVDEARTPLILSRTGDTAEKERVYERALELAGALEENVDYLSREGEHRLELSEWGCARLAELVEGDGGMWASARHREEVVEQALSALHLFHRDRHYIVRDEKVQIVDEFTGRVMADRAWERGLHQMIEVKEGCPITGDRETLARISYQRFFRRYLRLCGMTGTAREVTGELWSVYELSVVRIPTNRPLARRREPDRLYCEQEQVLQATAERIRELVGRGRAVLVGTRSVAASERVAQRLAAEGLECAVLNARQDEAEAEVVEAAGQAGRITVATNMAGRGTDIRLADDVCEGGGLHVLATERHEAARIDRQLYGRCGRQGDPGSYQAFASLEDDLVRLHCPSPLRALARSLADAEGRVPRRVAALLLGAAQLRVERRHARTRKALLAADRHQERLLSFAGRSE